MNNKLRLTIEILSPPGTRWSEGAEDLLIKNISKFIEAAVAFRSEGPLPEIKVVKLDALIVEPLSRR